MNDIKYNKLTDKYFSKYSLDDFIRHQEVTECWRRSDAGLILTPVSFVEDWDRQKCREVAESILDGISGSGFAYGAFCDNRIAGYIYVSTEFFGSEGQYIELEMFHVSEPFRRMGIGRELFRLACEEAGKLGAKKLYISAHSSKESQAAYRAIGCVEAEEINREIAESEPCDIQMEYKL